MTLCRLVVLSLAVVVPGFVPGAPARASQPERYALEMLANPVVIDNGGESGGLPPVVSGGFQWIQDFAPRSLSAGDTLVLDLALVPFRQGATVVRLGGAAQGPTLLFLGFADGLVSGVPYNRQAWNDVHVEVRIATQDYTLTVNGVQGGPFPLSAECAAAGGCTVVSSLRVEATVFDATTGWLDSVAFARQAADGGEVLAGDSFDAVGLRKVIGGVLVLEPPKNLRPR